MLVFSTDSDLWTEYIRLLQQHIAQGSREQALSSVHRHLDRSSWWRGEYERTKEALNAARDQTVGREPLCWVSAADEIRRIFKERSKC